jgi:hypothetical protein
MKQKTLYLTLIVLLTTLNVVQVGAFLLRPKFDGKHHRPPQRPSAFRDRAVQILKLDEHQELLFTEFGREHKQIIDSLNASQKQLLRSYFNAPQKHLLDSISMIESEKVAVTDRNFDQVKSILKEEQIKDFDEFKMQALEIILK